MSITIAVSTLAKNADLAMALAHSAKAYVDKLVVVIQGATEPRTIEQGNVKQIYCVEKGLSRSRNIAIESTDTDYIWFLDDDVIVSEKQIAKLISEISKHKQKDMFIGQIACSDKHGAYKDYSRYRNGKLGLFRVSSIEIIVSIKLLNDYNIRFEESYGLGACYPSGEENLFLFDIYEVSQRIKYLNFDIVYHPCLLEKKMLSKVYSDPVDIETKGRVARAFGGSVSILLLLRLCSKVILYSKNTLLLKYVVNGYQKGRNG